MLFELLARARRALPLATLGPAAILAAVLAHGPLSQPALAQSGSQDEDQRKAPSLSETDDALNSPGNRIRARITGPELLRLMEELGARPELSRDNVDDPMIDATVAETLPYTVFFYDCDDAERRACESLLFYIGFALEGAVSLEEINAWNAEQRFTRAYIDDEGDPILEMDAPLYGGLSETALAERVRTWTLAVDEFVAYLGLAR